jgi:predicted dehydrogenase
MGLKLALFGLGRWGNHLLRNLLALPDAEVIALIDPSEQRLQEICDRYPVPHTVQRLTHWQTAMALPDLHAVVIATPASSHYPMIKQALERGYHVLTEKPMTLDSATSEELCHLADRQRCQLVVDHTYLFHPAVIAGRQVCQQGQLGRLRYGYGTRTNLGPIRYDVDSVWDLAIHDIAIVNHWLGQTPEQVAAWGTAWLQPQPQPHFPNGLNDTTWLRLTYANRVEMVIHVSWLNADKQRRLALVGDQGTLVLDEMSSDSPLTLHRGTVPSVAQRFVPDVPRAESMAIGSAEPLRQVCQHFLDCVRDHQSSPISSGWQALHLIRLLEAITQAADSGGTVRLAPTGSI